MSAMSTVSAISTVEHARMVQVLSQLPSNAKIIALTNYMEKAWLPHDYCVKSIIAEMMKSNLSLSDLLKFKSQYSNWIKEHHITYAAVLNGRMDLMIYYDAYVEKQTLVMSAIKSRNPQMFSKVFNDTMDMFENMVASNSVPKEKINIKKIVWSWIDVSVSSGNYLALAIILPRVKSIIAGTDAGRLTRFLKNTPVDMIREIASVLQANDFNLDTSPNNYLAVACVHGFDDIIDKYASALAVINPINIGMSVNRALLDRYLALFDEQTYAVLLPAGGVVQLSSSIIEGALDTPYQPRMIDFIGYVLARFEIAPSEVKLAIVGTISYSNMHALITMGMEVALDISLVDHNERLAYLIANGVDVETIIKLLALSDEIIIGDLFVRALLAKDKNTLALVLSYALDCPHVAFELTSATTLMILNQSGNVNNYSKIAPIINALIVMNRLTINDNLWNARGSGAFGSIDTCRMNALINNSCEKYIINTLELWHKYNIFVDNEGFIWVALCCNFEYFGDAKASVIASIRALLVATPEIMTVAPLFDFIFQTRDYRYQSLLHNVNVEVLTLIIQKCPLINCKFALKLAVENSMAFKAVFDLFPTAWYREMFIAGGCLLRTPSFSVIFRCLIAKNSLPNADVIQRAMTLFAAHGKDDTIKVVIEWAAKGRSMTIKIDNHIIALLAMRDRSESLQYLIRYVNDKNNIAMSMAYVIGAYRRRTETVLKLATSGVRYQRLNIQTILAQKINEDDYEEFGVDSKIKAYNKQITDIAQKTKLYESLHNSVLTMIQYKNKQIKQ